MNRRAQTYLLNLLFIFYLAIITMNFLSHFYHEWPCSDPYFTAGVILPDILSNYSYHAHDVTKVHPWKLQVTEIPELQSLSSGLTRHYAVDGYFHDSDYFKKNTGYIGDIMGSQPYSCFPKRLFAIEHVLLELMLDRMVLKKWPETCAMMYQLIDEVDPEILTRFIALNSNSQSPEKATRHFIRFREMKFIYDYLDDVRLNRLLDMINRRLGNPAFSSADDKLFQSVIYDIENIIFSQKFPKFPTDS